jgi:chromosome segregation protein
LVQRKADLAELHESLKRIVGDLRESERRSAKRSRTHQDFEAEIASHRASMDAARPEADEARSYWQALLDELTQTQRSEQRLVKELESLGESQGEVLAVDLAGAEQRRDDILRQLASTTADSDQAENRLRDAEVRVQQAQTRLVAAMRRAQLADDAEVQRGRKLEGLGPEKERLAATIEHHRVEREQAEAKKAETDQRLDAAHRDRRALLESSLQTAEEAKSARANVAAMQESAHLAELSRARADNRRAAAAQRLLEEYAISEAEAMTRPTPTDLAADASQIVARLRREMRSMGDVNLGAIEAYDRLTARFEELHAQHADIEGGIAEVQKSIQELDGLTRERFLTTFAKVQTAFSETFQQLFGGGEGSLSLSDPTTPLESGVEIGVMLPGKRRQPLQLLSGGERSLCAAAFLFALLKVKPSPLVVLDEVDAPLDGRNVERFAELLHSYTENTQFIVITHNPTTIESAPVWLGVTMQEPGVSTLVPARIPETRQQLEAVVL